MPCRHSSTGLDGLQQPVLLRVTEILGGQCVVPTQDDQVITREVGIEPEDVLSLLDVEPKFVEQTSGPGGDFIRVMPGPTPIQVQNLRHFSPSGDTNHYQVK